MQRGQIVSALDSESIRACYGFGSSYMSYFVFGKVTLLSQCYSSVKAGILNWCRQVVKEPFKMVGVTCDGLPFHSGGSRNSSTCPFHGTKSENKRQPVKPLDSWLYNCICTSNSWWDNLWTLLVSICFTGFEHRNIVSRRFGCKIGTLMHMFSGLTELSNFL